MKTRRTRERKPDAEDAHKRHRRPWSNAQTAFNSTALTLKKLALISPAERNGGILVAEPLLQQALVLLGNAKEALAQHYDIGGGITR